MWIKMLITICFIIGLISTLVGMKNLAATRIFDRYSLHTVLISITICTLGLFLIIASLYLLLTPP